MERFTVPSGDGVDVSVLKAGNGPALLLVHGAMLNASLSWVAVLPRFSERFTVYAMDRRGRAPSGDRADYSIGHEAEDIARVLESVAEPATVLAHSYGALATIEMALTIGAERLRNIVRLILYEPPGIVAGIEARSGGVRKMELALAKNDPEEILRVFLLEQIGAPADVFAGYKTSPIWPSLLAIAPTLPREARTVNGWHRIPGRPGKWNYPTTLLLGAETTGAMRDGVMLLAGALPDCRLTVMEGQGHSAMLQSPDLFVDTVLDRCL